MWLIAAPLLFDFQAAEHHFRPYWVPLVLAVVIMLARTVNIGLAVALVAAAFLVRADVSSVVQINQIVTRTMIALVLLAVAIDAGKWLG
ncbi:hypothetical protein C8D88_10725 [Lentzea atacamensis]|uniref:Uncharacterized protein n=1 Tax=Lentzea atacamensis TaxID=531938 RepID=A0A316HXT6_9PSEU|nr:hypothetical protein C8D88_10725 [Lentzea atacamensis]